MRSATTQKFCYQQTSFRSIKPHVRLKSIFVQFCDFLRLPDCAIRDKVHQRSHSRSRYDLNIIATLNTIGQIAKLVKYKH